MRRYLLFVLLFFFAALLEDSFFSGLFPLATPALLIPLLVSLAIYEDRASQVYSLAFLAGFFQDLLSALPLGLFSLTYLLLTFLLHSVRRLFFAKGFFIWIALVLVFTLVSQLFYTLFFLIFTGKTLSGGLFLSYLFWHLFYTLLSALPLYFLSMRLKRRRSSEDLEMLA